MRSAPAASEIPLSLHLFDCLYFDGISHIDEPYEARWRRLEAVSGGKYLARLTDKEFTEMTATLKELQIADDGYTITVKPEVVVEVAYNEIQRSPQYSSGFALRFARNAKIREDKGLGQIATLAELQSLYERRFVSKSRRDIH